MPNQYHMQYAAGYCNGNHTEQHILNAYFLLLVLIRTSATLALLLMMVLSPYFLVLFIGLQEQHRPFILAI